MSGARESIMQAVTGALLKRRAPPVEADIAAEARRLLDRVTPVRPDRVGESPSDDFLARLALPAIGATAERLENLADFPGAVRRYLAANGISPSIALQPDERLQALDWSGIATHATIAVDEPVAVGMALGGIAETGSLVFHSGASSPTLFAFLPLHHIVAVYAESIWPWLEDYAAALDAGSHPRNVNLVTGASGTTDIEGALVRGAHGPAHLHVALIQRRTA